MCPVFCDFWLGVTTCVYQQKEIVHLHRQEVLWLWSKGTTPSMYFRALCSWLNSCHIPLIKTSCLASPVGSPPGPATSCRNPDQLPCNLKQDCTQPPYPSVYSCDLLNLTSKYIIKDLVLAMTIILGEFEENTTFLVNLFLAQCFYMSLSSCKALPLLTRVSADYFCSTEIQAKNLVVEAPICTSLLPQKAWA